MNDENKEESYRETLEWRLAAYGNIIRGDEETSEDQIAKAGSPEIARRLSACWNACDGIDLNTIRTLSIKDTLKQPRLSTILNNIGVETNDPKHQRHNLISAIMQYAILKGDSELETETIFKLDEIKNER